MEENRKLRERVKILKDFQLACRKRTGRALSQKKDARIQLISVPKPRANAKVKDKSTHVIYNGPAENSQVANYRDAMSKYPFSLSREPWSKEEKENLVKGIKQQFQEMLMQDLFSAGDGDSDYLDSMIAKIRDHEISPEEIRSFLPKVNWEHLSSIYLTGRSGPECESRWVNCEDPLINHQKWAEHEDKKLLDIVQKLGYSNWIDIAGLLGTNRTPFQCLSRFQRSLNASIIKNEWTPPEDEELRNAVAEYGETNWQLVASTLQGRTGTQCSNRWKKSLNPLRERVGKWAADEDKHLKIAVKLFGARNWNKIANFVPGRTQVQCRERWVNCLDPSLNMSEWTEEEDSKLKAAIAEHGHSWSRIAACIPPRTDSQCRRRWKVLFPHEVPLLQATRKIQKAAFISNFVDREEERPALKTSDFVASFNIESASKSSEIHISTKNKKRRLLPEHCGHDSSSGSIPKIRSRRARKITCTEKVSELTNEDDVEDNGDHADITGTGRFKNKRRSLKNKPSISSGETGLLDINNGEGARAFDGENGEMKKKSTRRARKFTHTDKVLKLTNGDDLEDNGDHAVITGTGRLKNKQRSLRNKPSISSGDTGLLDKNDGEGARAFDVEHAEMEKKATRRARKVTHTENVSKLTNEDDVEENGDHADITGTGRLKNKQCSLRNKPSISTRDTILLDIDDGEGARPFERDNAEMKKKATRRARKVAHTEKVSNSTNEDDIENNGDHAYITGTGRFKNKRRSLKKKPSISSGETGLLDINNDEGVGTFNGEDAEMKKKAIRRARKVPNTEEVPKLSDEDDVQGSTGRLKNKRRSLRNKPIISSGDTRLLGINNGEMARAFGGENAEMKKEAIGKRKRKRGGNKEHEVMDEIFVDGPISKLQTTRACPRGNEGHGSTCINFVESELQEVQVISELGVPHEDGAILPQDRNMIDPCSLSSPQPYMMGALEVAVTVIKDGTSKPCSP